LARKVFFHIGLPKTGTTYLQTIMWNNRERLQEAGLLLPGLERRDHLWSSLVVREDPNVARRNRLAPSSWERLLTEIGQWPGDAVISHEFFGSASAEQAARAIQALAPAEVHLLLTGREPLGLFTASWQESVKNKGTRPIGSYGRTVSDNPLTIWDWRALDLGLVLDRWATPLPAERVHILPLPGPGSPKELLWQRFAGVLGVNPGVVDLSGNFPNESMGVAETETLRRVNAALEGFDTAFDRGVWIRSYLADERLVPRNGERYWPGEDQVEDCRRRGRVAVRMIGERGYHVVGDVDDLLTPETLPERRHPDSVTDTEVAQVAVETIAVMLADVRRLTGELNTAKRALRRLRTRTPVGGLRARLARSTTFGRIRRRLRRIR